MTRWLRVLAGLAIAGLCLWLILRDLDRAAFGAALAGLRPGWLALAGLFLALGYACRIRRWQLMLRQHNPDLGWWHAAMPFLGSLALNNTLPFRLGDALRCFGFTGWLGVGAVEVTASVIAERVLDFLTVLLALILALLLIARPEGAMVLWSAGLWMALLGILLLLAMLLLPRGRAALVALIARLTGLAGAGAALRARALGTRLTEALADPFRGRRGLRLFAISALAWGFEAAMFWAVAMAMPAIQAPLAAWLAMPAGTLATLIPSTPGHIGTFDVAVIAAAQAAGNSPAAATGFALLVHLWLYIPTTLLGGLALLALLMHRRRKPQGDAG